MEPGLLAEYQTLGGCRTGRTKITSAYGLLCHYVIHAVRPQWQGGRHGEQALLSSCCRVSLSLAAEYDYSTVAFFLIYSGIYGYPKDQALQVAIKRHQHFPHGA